MDTFITELTRYMDESEGRGNRVISIQGVREMLARHETHRMTHTRPFASTVEYLEQRELERAYGANTGRRLN